MCVGDGVGVDGARVCVGDGVGVDEASVCGRRFGRGWGLCIRGTA